MIHLIIIWIVSHIEVHHSCTCVLASLIACFGLSCASSFFKRKYCNKDCNRQGAPNGTSFKLWEKPYEKKSKSKSHQLGERRETYGILVTISILIDTLKLVAAENKSVWQKLRTLKNYWWCPCSRNGHIYIRWWYWSSILQVVTVAEVRCYY